MDLALVWENRWDFTGIPKCCCSHLSTYEEKSLFRQRNGVAALFHIQVGNVIDNVREIKYISHRIFVSSKQTSQVGCI